MRTRIEAIQLFLDTFNNFYKPEYFKDKNGRKYLSYTQNGIKKTISIQSDSVKSLVISIFKEKNLGAFNKHIVEEIIDQLESNAYMSELTKEVFLRFGKDENNSIIVDLVDNGYCIIGTDGFQIAESVSTPFRRPQKMLSLPVPRKVSIDIFLDKFKSKFNFENPNDYILVLTFIIKSLVPKSGAHPTLILQGLQGTGKTTASKIIKKLIDPTQPLLFAPPGNIADIIVTANSSLLLAFDNLSNLNAEMTDLFCRISSGVGFTKRELYSDDKERSYDSGRPTLFNGINELTTRADFLDRAIIINLAKISNEQRKSEARLDKDFEDDYSDLFGGIICLVSPILKILPTIQDSILPRMTEFARFGIALEKVLNLESGTFLSIFDKNSLEKSDAAFWNDEICTAIYNNLFPGKYSNLEQNDKKIEGNISKIRETLSGGDHGASRKMYLTKTVKGFAGQLKRIEPLLNTKGIIVERLPRTSRSREIIIKLTDEAYKLAVQEYWRKKQEEDASAKASNRLGPDEAFDAL